MKRAAIILAFACACPTAFAVTARAQCPEGKQPVTMLVEKSGKVKVLCVSDNAVQGIENASENSATTIVPAACPKECWTPADVEYWATKGGLECGWKDANNLSCGSSAGGQTVFQLEVLPQYGISVCTAIDIGAAKIGPDESNACVAVLEPYVVPASPDYSLCPCLVKFEGIVGSIQSTDTLGCADAGTLEVTVTGGAGATGFFSFYPGSLETYGKQTCGVDNTSLAVLTDAQAEACTGYISQFISENGLHCGK